MNEGRKDVDLLIIMFTRESSMLGSFGDRSQLPPGPFLGEIDSDQKLVHGLAALADTRLCWITRLQHLTHAKS